MESTLQTTVDKEGGGTTLQWRVLHGAVAVNAFVFVIHSDVAGTCAFCPQRETVFHCFLECDQLSSLFLFVTHLFALFDEVFSDQMFILAKARLKTDFTFFILTSNVEDFMFCEER